MAHLKKLCLFILPLCIMISMFSACSESDDPKKEEPELPDDDSGDDGSDDDDSGDDDSDDDGSDDDGSDDDDSGDDGSDDDDSGDDDSDPSVTVLLEHVAVGDFEITEVAAVPRPEYTYYIFDYYIDVLNTGTSSIDMHEYFAKNYVSQTGEVLFPAGGGGLFSPSIAPGDTYRFYYRASTANLLPHPASLDNWQLIVEIQKPGQAPDIMVKFLIDL